MKFSNKYVLYAIIGILVIACGVYFYRAFDLGSKYTAMKTTYEVYRTLAKQDQDKMMQIIGQMTKDIEQRNKTISDLEGKVKTSESALAVHGKTLAELQRVEGSIKDKDQLIFNLRAQVSELTKMYSLAQGIISDQKKEIAEWSGKFDAQVKISESWKSQYESQKKLGDISEAMIKTLEGKARRARLGGRVMTVATVGAIVFGYITYNSIKK